MTRSRSRLEAESRAIAGASSTSASARPTRPWSGIDYNERVINGVRNALVEIYLHGVVGVSSPVEGHERKLVPVDAADRFLLRGRKALDDLESQKAPASARSWRDHNVGELRRLLEQAQDVRDGAPQNMTAEGYAEYLRSLHAPRFR